MSNGKTPLEQEFRTSQIYRTLTGAGLPADKIAQGIGKAAETIGSAISDAASPENRARARGGNRTTYTQPPSNGATRTGGTPAGGFPVNGVQTGPQRPGHPYAYGYSPQNGQPAGAPVRGKNAVPQAVSQKPMKMVRRGSPAKYYITAAAAMLYAANLPLYELSHYIVFTLVMVLVFFASRATFKGKKEWVPIEEPAPAPAPAAEPKKEAPKKAEPEDDVSTGDPEVDKLIREGKKYLKRLRAANDAIPDEALSEDIDRMEKASADIFRFISDHPEKAPQIRKFMNYYLPTTLKLLNSYQKLASQSVKGETITSTMFNIAGMMHTVATAFEKQLDSLFSDEAMDISADISVFETLLKQEGFVEEPKTQTKE